MDLNSQTSEATRGLRCERWNERKLLKCKRITLCSTVLFQTSLKKIQWNDKIYDPDTKDTRQKCIFGTEPNPVPNKSELDRRSKQLCLRLDLTTPTGYNQPPQLPEYEFWNDEFASKSLSLNVEMTEAAPPFSNQQLRDPPNNLDENHGHKEYDTGLLPQPVPTGSWLCSSKIPDVSWHSNHKMI